METKHTTGPWAEQDWSATGPTAAADYAAIEAVKDAVKEGMPEVFTRPVVQARGVGKAVICTAYGMSAEEVRANARLLAAAPDLLAALREARRAIGDHHAPDHCYATGPLTGNEYRDLVECPACSAIAMYDAAIAKATGSTQ